MRRAVEEANQTKAALHKALSTSSEVERVERVGKNEIGALKKQVMNGCLERRHVICHLYTCEGSLKDAPAPFCE